MLKTNLLIMGKSLTHSLHRRNLKLSAESNLAINRKPPGMSHL
jgi:hypothetical protein